MVANNLHSILANQTNVTLARNQRLVASWLPPPSPSEIQQPRVGTEPDEEDGQTLVPEPEFLGLGQALPKAIGSAQPSDPSSDAKLRRQLLGHTHDKLKRPNGAHAKGPRLPAAAQPTVFRTDKRAHESSSEDEPGRSALGRPALAKSRPRTSSEDETTNDLEGHPGRDDTSNASQQSILGEKRRRAADVGTKHYLDQVLAEKARKMRKRRKRHMRKEKMQRANEAGGTEATE